MTNDKLIDLTEITTPFGLLDDDLVKSRLGYTYDLKDALRHNPTIIQAGDDICAVALTRIEALEAENERLRKALEEVVVEYYKDDNGRIPKMAGHVRNLRDG